MLEANYENTFCLGIVEKLSGLGYSFNKRLLCLHDGVLSYYSKVPTDAENRNMTLLTFKELSLKPKLSIEIKYIKSVKSADKSLKKKKKNFMFAVEFRKSAFITNNKKDNGNPKNDKELQWVFAVNDENSLDKWIKLIEQAKNIYSRRRQEERKLNQEGEERLRIPWEYRYNSLLDGNLKTLFSIEDQIKTGFQLLGFIGNFRTEAVNLCKDIIDELPLAPAEKKYAAYERINLEKTSKTLQKVFVFKGVTVKITWAEKEIANGCHYVYTDKTIKSYNHEFSAMDTLNDVLYSLNKRHKAVVYRVPLTVRVDYKGFKCLVTSSLPVDEDETLQLGPIKSTKRYRVNKTIEDDLSFIARQLNLKEHTFVLDDNTTQVNVPLSVFTEVHRVVLTDEKDIRSSSFSEIELSVSDLNMQQCFYFTKTDDIFPADIDLEINKSPSFHKRLRPEFVVEYEKPLSADALLNNKGNNPFSENDDVEVAEAGIYLRKMVVPAFVKKLDLLEIIMTDSSSLTEALHSHGINIRYLGLICQQTNLPHVKEVCLTEITARTTKKILNKKISDIVLQNFDDANESLILTEAESSFFGKKASKQSSKQDRRKKSKEKTYQKPAETEQRIGDCVIEVLNLIFGKGEESDRFWSGTMTDQIMYDFNYDIKNFQKKDISLGGLLLAIIHHCNLTLKWDSSIEALLDKVAKPFARECYEGIEARSKAFSMHNLDVNTMSERYKKAKLINDYDLAIKSCLIAMTINKLLVVEDPVLLGDMAEIYYEMQQYDKAYEKAWVGLECSRRLHVEAVKCLCVMMKVHMIKGEMEVALKQFQQAIQHLNFHVGLSHPMHAKVYSFLESYYNQLTARKG